MPLSKILYVAGGQDNESNILTQCDEYRFNKNMWRTSCQKLPFGLIRALSATSNDGSFAIIIGGYKYFHDKNYNRCVIKFTEQDGFEVLKDVKSNGVRF